MVLNLLRIEAFKMEDLMRRSFFEDDAQRHLPEKEKLLRQHEANLAAAPKLQCSICKPDLEEFYRINSEIIALNREIFETLLVRSAGGSKLMSMGRVVLIHEPVRVWSLWAFYHTLLENVYTAILTI